MFGIDIVVSLIKGVLAWVEANQKVQEKIKGLITYLRAINTALTSFKPKGPPSAALTEILTVTYQCVRDIQDLIDHLKQGQKKWLFSPDSYYSKLNKKEHELSTIIPVLSLSFNMELYHKSEDIQAALSPTSGHHVVQPSYQLFQLQQPPSPHSVVFVQSPPQPLTFVPFAQPISPHPPLVSPVTPLTPLSPHSPLPMTPAAGKPGSAAATAKLAQSLSQGMSAAGAGAGAGEAVAKKKPEAKASPVPPPAQVPVPRPLADALLEGDARTFWKTHFKHALTVGTGTLVDKLEAGYAAQCGCRNGKFDSNTRDVLVLALDHNKDQVITIYEFAKFATPTLEKAVASVVVVPPTHKQDAAAPCHVLWCDSNESPENKKVVDDAQKAGSVVVRVPTAKDGIEYLKLHPDLLTAENFRVMSSNAIYAADPSNPNKRLTTQEVLDAKMSAAEDIIRYVRRKRSFVPVLIYCGFTYPQAEKIAKLYPVVHATKSQAEATAFAKLDACAWIQEKQKSAMA